MRKLKLIDWIPLVGIFTALYNRAEGSIFYIISLVNLPNFDFNYCLFSNIKNLFTMNTLPTIEEFLRNSKFKSLDILNKVIAKDGLGGSEGKRLLEAIIEFTKLHVQAALEAAAKKAGTICDEAFIDTDLILDAYSLSNIK